MKTTRILIATALGSLAMACNSGNSAAPKTSLSLSASVETAPTPSPTTTPSTTPTPSTPALDLGNGVSIDRVRVCIRKLKLEGVTAPADAGAGAASTTSKDSTSDAGQTTVASDGSESSSADSTGKTEVEEEHDDASEPVLGPLEVDLSADKLAGGLEQVFSGAVPQGTFHELKFAIGPDPKCADMGDSSVIVDGAVDGKGFEFASALVIQVKIENDIEVSDAKSNNVTLSLDPKKTGMEWFGGTGASRLDPSDPANKAAIEKNIEDSLNAKSSMFEDDDRSGHENHGGTESDGGAAHS